MSAERPSFLDLFVYELLRQAVNWCDGSDDSGCSCRRHSHTRGFAVRKTRTVHLSSKFTTRAACLRGLHEIAHIVLPKLARRYENEAAAEKWARRRARELGVSAPRKVARAGNAYVRRMKRWGDAIAAGRKS